MWQWRIKNNFIYDWWGKRSYSQAGEDMILRQLMDDKKSGFYVDVGAFHPKVFSNTYYFYKKGWRGVNVEPNREMWKLFNASRKRDINLNLGVAAERKKLAYLRDESPAKNRFVKGGKEKIEVWPLATIFEKYLPKKQTIDFLNVDVEGMEMEVLKSNNWNKFKPRVVVVEDQKFRTVKYLERQGYQVKAWSGLSLILTTKE